MTRFADMVRRDAPYGELALAADAMTLEERLAALAGLNKSDLVALFARAEGKGEPVEVDFLIPTATPKGHTVEWVGKNSLPLFSAFTKRFTRSREAGSVTGHNTGSMQAVVGPGYFTVTKRGGHPTELLFDYTRYPDVPPKGWPPLKRNERGISRLVFYDMHDYFRPIGSHFGIGGAFTSRGKFKGQYFALVRGPVLPIGT